MILHLDMSSDVPLYLQIRNQVVLGIGRGELQPGEGLPTVRQLAEDVGINTMTVNKAYALLKSEGYIEIDRRHGAAVRPAPKIPGEPDEALCRQLALLAAQAAAKGITREKFLTACAEAADTMRPKEEG